MDEPGEGNSDLKLSELFECAEQGSLHEFCPLLEMAESCLKMTKNRRLKLLHRSIRNKKTNDILSFLLEKQYFHVDETADDGSTCAHECALNGDVEKMVLLSTKGANLAALTDDCSTALHYAARNKNENASAMIDHLLSRGIFINSKSKDGQTPLLTCASHGNLRNFELLVSRGADIQKRTKDGRSVLHLAATNDEGGKLITFLVNRGMSVDDLTYDDRTPLHECARQGNLHNMKLLILIGANIQARDKKGRTALHHSTANQRGVELIEYLLSRGLTVNDCDDSGKTPLHCCAEDGYLRNMQLLVEKGADIEARDEYGLTALHCAVANADAAGMIEYLLRQGLPIDMQTNSGRSALHFCVINSSVLKNAELLIMRGARIDVKDKAGYTMVDHARRFGTDGALHRFLDVNKPLSSYRRDEGPPCADSTPTSIN